MKNANASAAPGCRAVARRDSNDIVRARVQFRCALAHAGSAGCAPCGTRTRSVVDTFGIRPFRNPFVGAGERALRRRCRVVRLRTTSSYTARCRHTAPTYWRSSRSRWLHTLAECATIHLLSSLRLSPGVKCQASCVTMG